ncbi:LPS export ABC transporter periplasmic protein LptC [Selenomonas ruminantium]|jgi:LPS export ABC transporter protein LptC|uniref:LPS export ABC transporter periplasmic protein LptC n=1 Tax=Selenomonas ruminantium TaxID=971 RepID=UPI00047A871C|nr:LPS export ABC transporter periplasmic protein LptC [Selenomonas ruminantium]
MDKKRKLWLGAGLAVFIAAIVWAVVTVPDTPSPDADPNSGRFMSYDGNVLSEEKNGRKIWDLTAEHIDVDVKTRDAKLEKLKGHFYAEDGRVVEVTADKGTYEDKTKNIVIAGNVDVKNSDGARLTSDELRWEAAKQLLAAVGSAKVTKEDMLATGERIESSDGFNKVKVIGKAHLAKGGNTNAK